MAGKVFVGGLPQNCSTEALSAYFEQFGTLSDSVVMKDRVTGNSRGFGFVTFEDAASVDRVMDMYKDHKMEDKWIEVKRATPEGASAPAKGKGKGGKGGGKDGGKAGDWQCTSCGGMVFASKNACFKCGAPKPAGGYGGYGGGGYQSAGGGYGYSSPAPAPGGYGGYGGYGGGGGGGYGGGGYGAPSSYGAAPPAYGGGYGGYGGGGKDGGKGYSPY
eukprot:TRINITY_DN433_c1_g2_i1.p2 TRINITY_DN433_c1_g2~~TRINITY_DN433_c1_g2_i1.p2  ORF type:complete len:217 (-),score=63.58 TRINITY_DN433_c1_g2_i1:52-702(-)